MDLKKAYLKELQKEIFINGEKIKQVKNINQWINLKKILNKNCISLEKELQENKRNIWIWSDHHFNHKNIIKTAKRPFKDKDTMNDIMLSNYFDVIKEGDVCIWCGDIYVKDDEYFMNEILPLLNLTYNILIIGNHDFHNGKLKDMNFDEVHMLLSFEMENKNYVLSHYPFDSGNHINIHGHTHQTNIKGKANVSVEVIDYKPFLLKNIRKIIN